MQHRSGQAGFTIIEIMVAAALFALVSFALFEVVRQTQNVTRHLAERHTGYLEVRQFADRLRAESLSAQAITASTGCNEVQFYMKDAGGPHFWAYRQNGTEIDRYAATGPLPACTSDANIEAMVHSVTSFNAKDFSIGAFDDAPFIQPGPASQLDVQIDLHERDASGAAILGGNHVVEVNVENDIASYVVDLTTGVKPSGYDKVLLYTCGARGGCTAPGIAAPPLQLLTGADISQCTATLPSDVTQLVAQPLVLDTDVPCQDRQGLCTYVGVWDVRGALNVTYSGKTTLPGAARIIPDAWHILYTPNPRDTEVDRVTLNSDGTYTYPQSFPHDPTAQVYALPSETGNGAMQSDVDACNAVKAENGNFYQNI